MVAAAPSPPSATPVPATCLLLPTALPSPARGLLLPPMPLLTLSAKPPPPGSPRSVSRPTGDKCHSLPMVSSIRTGEERAMVYMLQVSVEYLHQVMCIIASQYLILITLLVVQILLRCFTNHTMWIRV